MPAQAPNRRGYFAFRSGWEPVIRQAGIRPAFAFHVEKLYVIPMDTLVILFGFRRIDHRLRAGLAQSGNRTRCAAYRSHVACSKRRTEFLEVYRFQVLNTSIFEFGKSTFELR